MEDGIAARSGESRGKGVADQSIGLPRLKARQAATMTAVSLT